MVSETASYRSLGSIIPFRLRTDLEWVERDTIAGPGQWVVFDPVQTEYYYLNEVERKIAMLLDGRKSVQDIIAMVLPSYASTESIPFVSGLVQRMDQAGLLVANHWAKSNFLRNAEGFRLRNQNSVLGFKVPVCDPSPFISLIGPIAIWLFSWPFLLIVIFFSLGVISNLIPNAAVLTRDFHLATNMSFSQVAVIGCLLFFIKVLHEIGHALAGYRFGVICREVGLFFFLGIPCLYCDMTDSWRVKGKWSRIAIAAAGIYVEMIVATLAGIVWLSSDSLWIRISSVQIMLACSISTVLFNANPLLRYDGYFAVADMLGIVNLMDRARSSWNHLWYRWIFKNDAAPSRSLFSHCAYSFYYFLSLCYRWFLVGSLLLGIYAWFVDGKMRVIASGLPLLLLLFFLLQASVSYVGVFRQNASSFKLSKVRWPAVLFLLLFWSFAAYGLFFWRSNEYFVARAIVEPEGVVPVYLPRDATLVELLPDGAVVAPGDRVALANSFELNDELLRLQGELSFCLVRKSQWETRSTQDPSLVQPIVELNQKILGLRDQITQWKHEIEQLSIASTCQGTFSTSVDIPWSWRTRGEEEIEQIPMRRVTHGNPVLKRGMLLGTIAPIEALPSEYDTDSSKVLDCIRAYVNERDVAKIEVGNSVTLYVEQQSRKVGGTIERIGHEPVREVPTGLKNDMLYQSSQSDSKKGATASEYVVGIRLLDADLRLIRGGLTTVRFQGRKRTLAESIWNFVAHYGRSNKAPEVAAP